MTETHEDTEGCVPTVNVFQDVLLDIFYYFFFVEDGHQFCFFLT